MSHDQMMNEELSPSNKCRYKTGKCNNARSSKKNGQPHQLCPYHRDKANKIQRKFDRQKRQLARSKKLLGGTRQFDFRSSTTAAALASHDVEIYSDSDSSRFSTDSDSSSISVLDQLSTNLPQSVVLVRATFIAQANSNNNQGHLSHDEIDFLCSAVLEEHL
jgi:hypothetical protein